MRIKPYYPKRELIKTDLTFDAARRLVESVAERPDVAGSVEGDRFWLRPRGSLAAWYPALTGEVSEHSSGAWIEVSRGLNPFLFAVLVLVASLLLVWELGAIVTLQLQTSGLVQGANRTLPFIGGALLLGLAALIYYLRREGRKESRRLLSLLEQSGAEITPPPPEPPAETPGETPPEPKAD